MAEDALAVLDAAGVDAAHVYGFSLGGMVAQKVALRAPGRVRSLVIGATHPGGRRATIPGPEVISFFRRRPNLPQEEAAWASVPFNYGARCRREHVDRIAQDIARRLSAPFAAAAYRAQLMAGSTHDCGARLREISAPTLVVHGREDRMIPVQNAEALADGIPDARAPDPRRSGPPVHHRRARDRRRDLRLSRDRVLRPMRTGAELRVADVIREQAELRPDHVALRHGARSLTYGELNARSIRLAQALLDAGVQPGGRVAYIDRSAPEVIELLFAAAKIGAVAVPLNWRLAVPELTAILEDARPALLIAGHRLRGDRGAVLSRSKPRRD